MIIDIYSPRLSYLEQRLTLPIILASDYEPKIAFWTALVPSTAYLLAYHFVFKPQRRAKRLASVFPRSVEY